MKNHDFILASHLGTCKHVHEVSGPDPSETWQINEFCLTGAVLILFISTVSVWMNSW